MKKPLNIPKLLTLFRILAVIPVALLVASQRLDMYVIAAVLIVLSFLSDAIDGTIARSNGQESLFGARFDIIGDRVSELSFWMIFAAAGVFPAIMGVIYIVRGFVTDAIRERAVLRGEAPFTFQKTPLGRFLVASRFSRAAIGASKMTAFLLAVLTLISREAWPAQSVFVGQITLVAGWIAVGINLARGAPVVAEFILRKGDANSHSAPSTPLRAPRDR